MVLMAEPPTVNTAPREEAKRLLGLWETLSRAHVSMGAGCGCGAGGVTLVLEDF